MKTIRRNLNVGSFTLIVVILLGLFVFQGMSLQAQEIQIDKKIISSVTIDDNFVDDTIVIVFNKETSFKFGDFSPADFPEIPVKSIENINENATRIVQNQTLSEAKGRSDANDRLINHESFRRVIALKLYDNCKQGVLDAVKILEQRDDVISVSPSLRGSMNIVSDNSEFNDLEINEKMNEAQWGLNGNYGINALGAWSITKGSSEVIVGIIDAGIRSTHEKLRGIVDNYLSRDFTQENPIGHLPIDTHGHGTLIAGIIGAQANDTKEMIGINSEVTLASLRVSTGEDNNFDPIKIAMAVDYATGTFETNRPIRILNFSGGWTINLNKTVKKESLMLRQALLSYPGLFVNATENLNIDHDEEYYIDFPTNYSRDSEFVNDNVISVSAIDIKGNRILAGFGEESVSIYAPGKDILSTSVESDKAYKKVTGTSFATPHVVGVAALMLSVNPELTPAQIKKTIIRNGDNHTIAVPKGTQQVKRLNAHSAVAAAAFKTANLGSGISIDGLIKDFKLPHNTNLSIPDRIAPLGEDNKREVVSIGKNAFRGMNISGVEIPDGVTNIGAFAFEGTDLISVIIPESVLMIGDGAFKYASSLRTVKILRSAQQGITKAGQAILEGTHPLLEINLPDELSLIYYATDPSWSCYVKTPVYLELNETKNITSDLIFGSREFAFFNEIPRFVKIELSGGVMPWERMLVVRDQNRNQIEVLEGMGLAESSMYSTEVTVFLPTVGKFFIDTQYLLGPGKIFLKVEEVRKHDVDFSPEANLKLNILKGGYGAEIVKLTVSQHASFNISIAQASGLTFIIYKFDGYSFDYSQSHWFFNGGNGIVDLTSGIYYIGYLNGPRGWSGNINIIRLK
ncbi:MAG: S8 family serine peptidase [Erysipelotrichales bacterium]|nr:S8 family serine peptidase [Erysipelotrichales bacterium]